MELLVIWRQAVCACMGAYTQHSREHSCHQCLRQLALVSHSWALSLSSPGESTCVPPGEMLECAGSQVCMSALMISVEQEMYLLSFWFPHSEKSLYKVKSGYALRRELPSAKSTVVKSCFAVSEESNVWIWQNLFPLKTCFSCQQLRCPVAHFLKMPS